MKHIVSLILFALIYFPEPGKLIVVDTFKTKRDCNLALLKHSEKRNAACTPTRSGIFSEVYR